MALSLIAAFLIALVAAVASRGRADSSVRSDGVSGGPRLLLRSSGTDPSADYWQNRFRRMKLYARKQEKLRSVQSSEIRKIRALIPQPFWVPAWFRAQALCIHRYESRDWHNRGHHFGGLQFTLGTWQSVGGRGNPADASPAEQIYRAFLVWKRDGGSWREWSTAGACGL